MDIIDIMLARAMTPQGQTEIYLKKAARAAELAEQAKTDATSAVATVEDAADEIAAAKEEASDLLATAQEALETAQSAQINTLDTEDVDTEIKKLNVDINNIDTNNAKLLQLVTTYPDNTLDTEQITKLYKQYGDNEDGTMTQKAIKAYVEGVKTNLQTTINNISVSGGGSINLGSENAGHIVVIDENGNIISGTLTENELTGITPINEYVLSSTVGLTLDSENKSFERSQEAVGKAPGADFDKYPMFGGRKRCNVSDDGTITAFYGDSNYRDDGSNGQVMVYQPKFYYQRIPLKTEDLRNGKVVRKETLLLSGAPHPGFKLHPLFQTSEGETLEYVLLSAYQGCAYDVSTAGYLLNDEQDIDFNNDKLSSIAGAKPISGATHHFNISDAEKLAVNRGEGWHIMNMAAQSANQMLQIAEFGMFNGQTALEDGLINLGVNSKNINLAASTGSTASLGNATGHAIETTTVIEGVAETHNDVGRRAISYRGMENPWGNMWNFIGGTIIYGRGTESGGTPYICTDFNYTPNQLNENYVSIGFSLPAISSWASGMGYGNPDYDWVYMPAETASSGNSVLPIGDFLWITPYLNGIHILAQGSMWNAGTKSGLFSYACDYDTNTSYKSYGARLMYIPTINATYTANYQAWLTRMGA